MHAYNIETGEPCHEIPTKKGAKNATRATRVSDLNKLGLYPSVTTIISDIASPDLENWRINEHIKAAWDIPVIHEETFEGWSRLVRERATKGTTDAADFGTLVHSLLDAGIGRDGMIPREGLHPELWSALDRIMGWVACWQVVDLQTERVSVNRAIGFAGTIDLSGYVQDLDTQEGPHNVPIVIDYKTKKTKKDEPITVPETYPWQLAAYHVSRFGVGQRELHPLACACNIFISSTEPGRWEPVWYTREQLEEGWEAFKLCHRLYCIRNKWKPKIAQ